MLKRKILSTGYAASSGSFDEEVELRGIPLGQSTVKTTRSGVHIPSGFLVGARSASVFQYSGLSSSTRDSVPPAFAIASSSMHNSSAPASDLFTGPKGGARGQSTVPGDRLSSSDSGTAVPLPDRAGFSVKPNNQAPKQKDDADDSNFKEHVRSTFYRMLGIVAAEDVHPHSEDEHDEPDTLPVQFMDPDADYRPLLPHWHIPLPEQAAWTPTYMERFLSTIPKDDSELNN